jgi:hypothetical protein
VNLSFSEAALLPTRRDEEALLTTVRGRIESAVGTARIRWDRPDRSAEREDLRSRLSLDRSAFDRLPSGCPGRGRVVLDGLFPNTTAGVTVAVLPSWSDLAVGGTGAITVTQAADFYREEQARWQSRYGAKPFFAAIAGTFAESLPTSPFPNLALLAWRRGAWDFEAGFDSAPQLAQWFYPQTIAACAAKVQSYLDRSPNFPRLLSEVADDLQLPAGAILPASGKNVGAYALEYRSGHHLFYRR